MDYTTEENELLLKKDICKNLITSRYSTNDQINTLNFGTQEEQDEMNAYIGGILDEYRTNGKDADFSSYIEAQG